jgi:hypothetical protein
MNAMSLKKMVVVLVLVGVLAGLVQADKLELQAKLSKEVKIQLKDVTVVEALEKIGEKADLEIVLSDEAVWKLPQGGETRLRVMLQGPLAESLTEMLNAFFMRYAVGEEQITIYPRPELEHILGRPTAKQLHLLREIYTAPMETYQKSPQKTINNTLGDVVITPTLVHRRIDEILHELAGMEQGLDKFDLPGPMTIANMLDQIRVETPIGRQVYMKKGNWYLSEATFPGQIPEIRVVNKMDFRQAKLDQIVDVYTQGDAAAIIQRLANWAGMELYWEKRDPDWPGGTISVDIQNIKLGQALRNVISMVDGGYEINVGENRIRVVGPKKRPTPRATRTARRPSESGKITRASGDYVGKISIPMDGGKYYIEFMLRESDLTEELRKLRDEKMEQILGRPPKPRPAVAPEPEPRKPAPAAKPAARRSR